MRSVFLTFFLTAIGTLYAQSSSSQSNGTFEDSFNYINELFAKDQESIKFCKENSMGLNLLILDGYYVIDAHPNGRIASIECNTHTTRVYTEDTPSRRHPASPAPSRPAACSRGPPNSRAPEGSSPASP